jgi:GT2 family glycosyltransferase/glycosyltransferase involved in cell wall biosynthesis
MRVLEVVHGLPPAACGGTEIYALAHARALAKQYGDEVYVLAREADPSRADYAVRRETREPLEIVWINNTFRAARSFAETYRNHQIDSVAAGVLDDIRPEAAHIHHLTCLSTGIVDALHERGIPCIYTLHDYWLMCHRGQLLDVRYRICDGPGEAGCEGCVGDAGGAGAIAFSAAAVSRATANRLPQTAGVVLRRVSELAGRLASTPDGRRQAARARLDHMKAVLPRVTRFLAPSEQIRQRFIRFGVAPERIALAGYGIDHEPFRQTSRRLVSQLRFAFLGSLIVSKGAHVLLEAFARLPRGAATLTLYGEYAPYHGDDSYRAPLKRLLSCEGVRFAGPLPHDQVAHALADADVLVVPSIWPENSPFVIHEAFRAGMPVVASRIGGIPELVTDGVNGFLVAPDDVASLHATMQRLVDDRLLLSSVTPHDTPVRTIEADAETARAHYVAALAGRTPGEKRIAAVVLNYGAPDQTILAVKSLSSSRRPLDEIIVVDNDEAETFDGWRRLPATAAYVPNGRNLGFSGGMNVGIRAALSRNADAILLVNSDVVLPPDCVAALERCLEDETTGIAGPVLRSRSDPRRIASLGMKYTPATGRMYHLGAGEPKPLAALPTTDVDAVSGCVMLVKSAVFREIGVLDEDFFFSFEDLDLCLRARRAGFRSRVAGAAVAYHEGGRSIGASSPRRLYFAARNHLLVAGRQSSPSRIAHLARSLTVVMLNVAHAVRARGATLPTRLLAVARGTRHYALGRYGSDA